MNCEQCQELLSDHLDGTLKGGARARVEAHLEECIGCALVREEFQSILTVARASLPFFFLLVIAVGLITVFPQIVMYLPRLAFPD